MNTFDWNHYTNFVTFHTCEHIYWDAIFSDPPSPKSAENKKVDLPAIIYFLYFNMASIFLLNFLPHWNSLIFSTLLPLILKTAARTPRHIGFLLEEETFSRWRRTGETCSSTFPQRICFQPSKPSNAVRVPSFLHGARSGAGGGEERLPVDHLPLRASNRHLHLGGGELGRGEGGPRGPRGPGGPCGPGGPGGRRQRRFWGGGEDKLEVDWRKSSRWKGGTQGHVAQMLRKFIVALHLENWCKSLPSLPTYSSISSFHKMLKCTTSRLAESHSHKPTQTVQLEKLKFQTNIYSWRLNTFVGDLVTFWSCFLGQIIGPHLRWNKTWLNRCVYVAASRQVWRRKTRKQDNRENNLQNMSSR